MLFFFLSPLGGFVLFVILLTLLFSILFAIFWIFEKLILRREIITKQNGSKILLVAITIIIIASAILTYQDFHPGDKVYIDEWNKYTDISLPASFKIQDKYYGYPDISGDFTTTALYSYNETDYLALKQKIISDTSYHKKVWLQDEDIGVIMNANNLSDKDFTIKLSKESYGECQIGFIDKNNSILFYTYSY